MAGGAGRRAAGLIAVLLLGAACGPGPVSSTLEGAGPAASAGSPVWPGGASAFGSAPGWWAQPAGRDLEPVALAVVASGPPSEVVVDGSGATWLRAGWTLVRIDPDSGAWRSWDAGDDAAFGTMSRIRPAAGAGVWLAERDQLHHFDGTRLTRTVPLPAAIRGGPDQRLSDMVEVAADVWVSSSAGVSRYSAGRWTTHAAGVFTGGGALAADPLGGVWAAGRLVGDSGPRAAVVRIDPAGRWTEAAGEDAPSFVHELVPVPTGGVLARWGRSLTVGERRAWRRLPVLDLDLGDTAALRTVVTDDGAVWVAGVKGLARLAPGGAWVLVEGVPGPLVPAMATSGDSVVVLGAGAAHRVGPKGTRTDVRWDGEQVVRTSREGESGPGQPAPGTPVELDHLVAVSAVEAWGAWTGYPGLFHRSEGRWREEAVGPVVEGSSLVAAGAGGVWATTEDGLVRVAADGSTTALPGITAGRIVASDGGSVWVVPPWSYGWWYRKPLIADAEIARPRMIRVGADGERSGVPLPGEVWTLTSVAGGTDGAVWVVLCEDGEREPCPSGSQLVGWDGARWQPVPHPGQTVSAIAVADDRALWAVIDGSLLRYARGTWTASAEAVDLDRAVPAPGGAMCGLADGAAELLCVSAAGRATGRPLPSAVQVLSIASDGAAWIAGPAGVAVVPSPTGG